MWNYVKLAVSYLLATIQINLGLFHSISSPPIQTPRICTWVFSKWTSKPLILGETDENLSLPNPYKRGGLLSPSSQCKTSSNLIWQVHKNFFLLLRKMSSFRYIYQLDSIDKFIHPWKKRVYIDFEEHILKALNSINPLSIQNK